MPAIRFNEMISYLLDAIQSSGASVIYLGGKKPPRFAINYENNRFELWVYIWTLTHGGRKSLPREYRIQMTSVQSPLLLNPNGYTVLMGYHAETGMFAGFDLAKHRIFTTGSPSVQISLDTLDIALQNGFGFSLKENEEIVIGIRPDMFIQYCINAHELHLNGNVEFLDILQTSTQEFDHSQFDQQINQLPTERKLIVQKVQKFSRESKFRKIVLSAYENRCAISRMQLKLLDAAHILPVANQYSTDNINNGLALNPTLHRAYDNALIYIDENFLIKLNQKKIDELRSINLLGGLDYLQQFENRIIHLPQDDRQKPNRDNIRQANKFRQIDGY